MMKNKYAKLIKEGEINMDKLQELKNYVAKLFENATEKSSIDQLTQIKALTDGVEKEHEELVNKNAELIKDYKEVVMHTSFKDSKNEPTDPVANACPSFEDVLSQFIQK